MRRAGDWINLREAQSKPLRVIRAQSVQSVFNISRIKDLLPGSEGLVSVTAYDNRLFVEAVLYRYRAGIPWRRYG